MTKAHYSNKRVKEWFVLFRDKGNSVKFFDKSKARNFFERLKKEGVSVKLGFKRVDLGQRYAEDGRIRPEHVKKNSGKRVTKLD